MDVNELNQAVKMNKLGHLFYDNWKLDKLQFL